MKLTEQSSIAPLVIFRVLFGAMMFGSILRFLLKGWVYELYVKPEFFFPYYGFEWLKPLNEFGMYAVFFCMALASLMMMLGFFYRIAAVLFFLSFTYVELIDKSNYLNHYYFVSIISFLLIFLPAAKSFSLDTYFKRVTRADIIPHWLIMVIQVQVGIVYFYAGLAKINSDWLIEAQPLRIWLQAHSEMPVFGYFMDKHWVAYVFSWFGMLYDLSIPFLLLIRKTRVIAFFLVVVFHVMTSVLFPIGMFPFIMILSTLIFFPAAFHEKIISFLRKILVLPETHTTTKINYDFNPIYNKALITLFICHFTLQLLVPFRFLLYPGNLFWTEQGYRFSWRVMLMEKAGNVFFYVNDPDGNRHGEAMMDKHLTPNQEKMMSTQPDMILQYALYLDEFYKKQGIRDPEIRAEAYVTLNGSGSRLFIDKTVDLSKEEDSFRNKNWILPWKENVNE